MPESTMKSSGFFKTPSGETIEIREVWASNLDEEMENMERILDKYPYVAMDTEFPGVVARPNGDFGPNEILYQTLRCNVDLLKIIQLGLSFSDGEGNLVPGCTCWQFNFKFSLSGDIFAEDSIELLKTSGIDFDKFEKDGIDVQYFGELLTMSGLVLNDKVKWVSFHSSYDFGYLLKLLTCTELPLDEQSFLDILHIFFPNIFDIKFMMTSVEGLYGGLSALADTLQVERIGPMHQAGSDSLLTGQNFFALIKKHLGTTWDESKFRGELFGIGNNHTKYKNKTYASSNNNQDRNNNSFTSTSGISVSPLRSQSGGVLSSSMSEIIQYSASSTVHYPLSTGAGTTNGGALHHSNSISSVNSTSFEMYDVDNGNGTGY